MGKSVRSNNPFVLGAEDSDQIPVKQQPQQQPNNPFVLGAQDSHYVKKKAGGDGSASDTSHTPSESPEQAAKAFQDKTLTKQSVDVLADTDAGKKAGLNNMSPDAREVFAQAHNGPKKSDLVQSVTGILDTYFPKSLDPAQNKKTFDMKQAILQGNQDAIIGTRDNLIQGLQKKIDQRKNEIYRPLPGTLGAKQYSDALLEADATIQQLKAQQKKVTDSFNEYGKQSLVSSKDMEAWLKLDAEHPNIQTSIASEKLGKAVEEKYGIERETPNKEHDRMASGMRLIMQSLQMDVNEALAYGIPTKNPELLKKAQDKIATLARYRDMYEKLDTEQFPDVGLDKTARFLGDIIAEKHPNKLIRTAADVREAGKIANERNPGFMDKYGKFVETAAQKQDQGTFIPRGGGVINEFVGGVISASARNALDLLKWKARAGTLSETDKTDLSRETSPGLRGTTQSGTETTKITYDKEGKAYRELPNENYSTLPWNNFFRFAGESAPGLAEFIAAEGTAKVATEALSFGRAGAATKQFAGLLGATYLTSYNSNREFADANIDDKTSTGEAKKIVLANLLTVANAGVFHALGASPSKLVEKAISKAVTPDVLEVLEKNSWEQLSQKTAEKLLKDKILPRAKAIVQKFGENLEGGAKMGAASVIDQKIHDLAGVMTNTNYRPSTVEDNARSFVQQALLMTVVGLPGMISSGAMPHTTREALHEAGLYGPQYIDQINERVQNGDLDPVKANGMIAMIKTMHEELGKAAKETNDDGTPLTIHQQRDLAIANFRKRAAASMEEQGLPVSKEGAESEADKDIKNIKQQNNWQNIEDTPTFKSIKEQQGKALESSLRNKEDVQNALDNDKSLTDKQRNNLEKAIENIDEYIEMFKSQKPVESLSDIDPTARYYYEKDGKIVLESGSDLIHHLETGDIYEKEKPDNKKTPTEKTENTEVKGKDAEDKKTSAIAQPVSEKGKAAIKEANEREKEVEDAGFNFLTQEDDGEFYNKNRKYESDEVPIGMVGLKEEEQGKGLGTLAYILKGEEYLKQGRHLVSDAPHIPEARTDQATGVWKKLVKLGLATETSPGSYRYGGEREGTSESGKYKPNIRDDYFAKADFFTPEEKKKFETLDDDGKDKMIDDKRAELKSAKHSDEEPNNLSAQDEQAAREADANISKQLQASYDRLIASGTDPSDPEMKRLQERIESLSPKTETDGNVKTEQSGDSQKEGVSEGKESGQESEGPDKKGDVLTPESETGAAKPPEDKPAPTPENSSPIVGIRDSIVNADRIHKGLEPLVKEFTRHWQDNWNQIKKNIRKGFSPRKFIEDTAAKIAREDKDNQGRKSKKRTTFSDYDYATLLFDRLDIQNNIARADDVLRDAKEKGDMGSETAAQQLLDRYNEQLMQNDIVGRRMKSESGRALSAIQMMTKMDGELVNWTRDLANLYHGTMPDVLKTFVERIEKDYKQKTEELRQHYESLLQKAAEDAFTKWQEDATKTKKTDKPTKTVKTQGKELADKIRGLRDKLGTNKRDSLQSNIFGLPIAIADSALVTIANLVEGGAKLIDAINEALKDVKFDNEKDRDAFISHLQNTEDPESEQAKRANSIENIKSIAKEQGVTTLPPEANKDLQSLMKSYIKDGVKSLDELVKKTMEDIKGDLPDVEERDVRDAFSGYGPKPDGESKMKSDLAKLKEQSRKVSEYQDLLQKPAGETLAQEARRLEKARKLADEVNGYMREMGIEQEPPPTTPEAKKALALEKSKARMKSVIEGLNKQILAGERKERNGITPDRELSVLKSERDRLSKQLDEIEKAKVSPEEKIKQTVDALNRQILNYERQIREGVDLMKPKEERPSTKQIEQLRKRKNELKKEVEGIRRDTDPNYDPQKRALEDYNEGLQKRAWELEDKIENKDYAEPEPPNKVDFSKDKKSIELESNIRKLEANFYAARKAGELINRSWLQKAMSFLASLKRSFVLSRISTFGRLVAADFWSNAVFSPLESVSGTGQYLGTKIGFAKKLSQQADRYGVSTKGDLGAIWKGEVAAIKALGSPQTWKDFVSDAKNGYSELTLMYAEHQHIGVPKELRDHWQTIEHGLEVIGRTHGAVKGISKRMEFMRSYVIRKEAARRKGADVDNPVIQASIGAMAYKDALRHILMEDNMASKGYAWVIDKLEKQGLASQFLALGMKELMPIVKIPTNLVLNAVRGAVGTPLAGGMIAFRGLVEVMSKGNSEWGISKLTPEQSDALLRNLRKGNVGMALMIAGFVAPNMFGAAHYYQKGSEQPEGLAEGEVNFFGVTVPRWLADNPYLVTMKIGASLRSAFDYYTDEKDQSFAKAGANALIHTMAGAAEETPLIGSPAQLYQAATGYGGDYFWYNFVKGTAEPGLLQEIAEDTDNTENNLRNVIFGDFIKPSPRIKRKPSSIGEALETGLPGARENVEEK